MTIKEIKEAVDRGIAVCWSNTGYRVKRGCPTGYYIEFLPNGYCFGLTNLAGDRLNGEEHQFFTMKYGG